MGSAHHELSTEQTRVEYILVKIRGKKKKKKGVHAATGLDYPANPTSGPVISTWCPFVLAFSTHQFLKMMMMNKL